MTFRILGLDPEPFKCLYGLSDIALAARRVRRQMVDTNPGFPDRIEVRDVPLGASVLLLNHVHQPADTAYRASHAIFIREFAQTRCDLVDSVPDALRVRTLSLRAFSKDHDMVDADLVEGADIEVLIARMLADLRVSYLHAHYAKPGCYAARIERDDSGRRA